MRKAMAFVATALLIMWGCEGNEGPTGPEGPEGQQGIQGDLGPEGPQGDPGADGTDGQDGIDGTNGTDGTDGLPGAQGPQGNTGPQGPQGSAQIFWESFESGFSSAWTWSGNAAWWMSTVYSKYGNQSARSGIITHSQTSSLSITADFPSAGIVSFYGGISSEVGFDWLRWYVDGVMVQGYSGYSGPLIVTWFPFSFSVSPGTHTIRWSYEKDATNTVGSDAGWIDGIVMMGTDGTAKIAPQPELPEGFMYWTEAQELGLQK